jgi:membrane protein
LTTYLSLLSMFLRRMSIRMKRLKHRLLGMNLVKFLHVLIQNIGYDDTSNMAASIAYYTVLSLFPLLLGLLAIFGLFLPSQPVQQQLINLFNQFLPGSSGILEGSITDIIRLRGTFGVVGILGLFWSGTGVFSAVTRAVNKAWDIKYQHPFYLRKPREIGLAIGSGLLLLLSLGASTFLTYLSNLNLDISGPLINVGTAFIAFVFSLIVFTLIHKFIPISGVRWNRIWPGALLSAILFEIAKTILVFYLNHNHYDKIYGSIASLIALLVWIYYSAFILLLGAEFNSMLFRWRREGEIIPKSPNVIDALREF